MLHQKLPAATGLPDYFPRVTTDAMLETPAGNHVRVMGGHYNGPTAETDYQSAQVRPVAQLADDWVGPTIWGADWNVKSDSPAGASEHSIMSGVGLTDAFDAVGIKADDAARKSFGDTPRTRIDRIYVSKQVDVRGIHVAPYPAGEPGASDHHPLIADLHLTADQGAS
jgi:endonuclease/exonuclease/phosphatase family metal-dependent hydrolase